MHLEVVYIKDLSHASLLHRGGLVEAPPQKIRGLHWISATHYLTLLSITYSFLETK